jgi:hypothetical protein
MEPAKDWRSDCLGKQNLLVVELYGVLERLHSIEGLSQSNNNAKLNKGSKHITKVAGNKCKVEVSKGKTWRERTVLGGVVNALAARGVTNRRRRKTTWRK